MQHVAQEATSAAKDAAKNEAQKQNLTECIESLTPAFATSKPGFRIRPEISDSGLMRETRFALLSGAQAALPQPHFFAFA